MSEKEAAKLEWYLDFAPLASLSNPLHEKMSGSVMGNKTVFSSIGQTVGAELFRLFCYFSREISKLKEWSLVINTQRWTAE
ncbi:MAG TPA: hypothetical protein PKE06_15090, partial [Flavilitoribacter sp.]|nr:hypothetical protein [Flavilitoribacter sp.]HMQ89584.1 hypothetical protein [Flavilitoribacter sp.]